MLCKSISVALVESGYIRLFKCIDYSLSLLASLGIVFLDLSIIIEEAALRAKRSSRCLINVQFSSMYS